MKSSKRIISFILAFAMVFPLYALSASADYISSENFGSWVTRNSPEFIQRWSHGFFGAGCTVSDDGRHHASSYQSDLGTGYYDCICSDCGHAFRAYYQDSYDQSVSELPSTSISSDGSLLIYIAPWDLSALSYRLDPSYPLEYYAGSYGNSNYYSYTINLSSESKSGNAQKTTGFITVSSSYSYQTTFNGTSYLTHLRLTPYLSSTVPFSFSRSRPVYFITPYSGYYKLIRNYSVYDSADSSYNYTLNFSDSEWSYFNSGSGLYFLFDSGVVSRDLDFVDVYISYPVLAYKPDTPYDIMTGDTYNIENRVGSLVGNYTYEGDNGTQVIAEDIQIVNETDQSVYNPVTNETYYYNEYTYNYGDRSYDFSFGDRDDHVSVTYGDDCVTIEDGDHTYTIYYTTASNHEHSYRITNIIDPTCTEQGKIYKSCSECGDELIEFTDALGHDWQITEQTAVDYVLPEARCPACESQYFTYELVDEVFYCICQDCGQEWSCNADVMEGHTTYTCSRCGEERTETNQEQDLSLFEAIGDLLADTFEWITDKLGQFINSLSGLSESFSSRIESIIESVGNYPLLFGAFLAGMPGDLMNIVWFGVIALVFVLVWKKFFS